MENSRRSFLKIAGISALGLSAKPVLDVMAASGGHDAAPQPVMSQSEHALTAKRWAMVVDTRQFHSERDFEPLIQACHKVHNVPEMPNPRHEVKWIWYDEFHNVFPGMAHERLPAHVHHVPFLVLCNHCEDPSCVRACPTKATFKRESDGIVLMDMHRCIGCRFCMAACPYGARSFNFLDPEPYIQKSLYNPEYPRRMKGVVEKCNFCAERLAVGKMPACVEASGGKLAFGDLEDPHSEVNKLLHDNYSIRRKQGLGTGPSIFYII